MAVIDYKHGVYGEQTPSANSAATAVGTVPAYIGTAPIQQEAPTTESTPTE